MRRRVGASDETRLLARTATVTALALSATACALNPPTPPMLRQVTTGYGGWASAGCPPTTAWELALAERGQEASSPELSERLRRRFPPGTEASALHAVLATQGFKPTGGCPGDPTISRMVFSQAGGGLFGPFPVFAIVAWKADPEGLILWTKGQVSFTGL